jgi:hypothetical protein
MDDAEDPGDDHRSGRRPGGPPSADRVRLELETFAELIRDLARKDSLLNAVPFLLGRLGDLCRLLFDYEVRAAERLLPVEDPTEREARRIIREAEERKREMMEEWGEAWRPDRTDAGQSDDDPGPQQPRFHWFFRDESASLAGSLHIEIHRDGRRDTTLTVFEAGRLFPGWAPISRDQRGISFGFVGGGPTWMEPTDSLVVSLEVTEALEGVGSHRKGVFPKGRYRATASYGRLTGLPDFGLLGRNRQPTAFVSCWRSKWDSTSPKNEGGQAR